MFVEFSGPQVSLHPLPCLRQHLCVSLLYMPHWLARTLWGMCLSPHPSPHRSSGMVDMKDHTRLYMGSGDSKADRHVCTPTFSPLIHLFSASSSHSRLYSKKNQLICTMDLHQQFRGVSTVSWNIYVFEKIIQSEPTFIFRAAFFPVPALWFLMGILLLNLFGHHHLSLLPHFAQWTVVILFAFPLQAGIMKNKMCVWME